MSLSLTQELEVPQPTVSRHLKVLREGGLVKATRQGASVQYELDRPPRHRSAGYFAKCFARTHPASR